MIRDVFAGRIASERAARLIDVCGSWRPDVIVRDDRFVQEALVPHCDVVVSHAGSGSVIGALAFLVPLVLLPMGADQP